MTSPATNPGTVARGAAYRCTACGRLLDHAIARHWTSYAGPLIICDGPLVELGAGVTLPTAIQPVGGDQLEPGRAGQVEGAAGADVVEQERSRP